MRFTNFNASRRAAQLGEVAVSALELLELAELLFRHILLILAPLLLVDLHCFEEVLQRRLHDVPNPLRRLGSARRGSVLLGLVRWHPRGRVARRNHHTWCR